MFASVAAASLMFASAVAAQDTKPDTTKPLKVTAGVAYLNASGNTDVTSLAVDERLEWKRPRFLWAQFVKAINSSTDGEQSADLLAVGLRGDWKPHGRLSVYALTNYDRNRFANIGRRFEEGAGLGYLLIDRPMHRLTTELGTSRRWRKRTAFSRRAYRSRSERGLGKEAPFVRPSQGLLSVVNTWNRTSRCASPEVVPVLIAVPVRIPVHAHAVARPPHELE